MSNKIAWFLSSAAVLTLAFVIAANVLVRPWVSLAAIHPWVQTEWSGGEDGGIAAIHPTDQDGWTTYANQSGISVTDSPEALVLAQENLSLTDDGMLLTTGLATGGGFGNGMNAGTAISGTGTAAKVRLASTAITADLFSGQTSLAPAPIGAGGTMLRNGADDNIYVLQGNGATGFFKYTISTNSWTELAAVPGIVGAGAQMIRNGGDDDIYVLRGLAGDFE